MIKKTKIKKNQILINWIGQAGFIIKDSKENILCIDPYYSNSIERYEGRPSRRMWYNDFIIEYFRTDYVFCSHDHLDHTDPETIPLLYAYSNANFYGPKSSFQHMKKMKIPKNKLNILKRNERYNFDSFTLKTTFADHTKDSLGFIF